MRQLGLIVAIFAAMALVLLGGRDRSIDLANHLSDQGQLRSLDPQETGTLRGFMSALLAAENIEIPLAINQRYEKGRLNIYVVETGESTATPGVSRGNAAYVAASDIIFIDAAYFVLGSEKVFSNSSDDLNQKVLAPLRVHAFFVLAHELGHRQLHSSWFRLPGFADSQAMEVQADKFAIATLKKLYANEAMRKAAGIPEAIGLLGFFGEVTPLQRMVDHLGYSLSFMADDIFESPFPILTGSATHPAFFGRMRALIESLRVEAVAEGDEDAVRQLDITRTIIAGTDYLISLGPTEIEFNGTLQYAYLDEEKLHIVGADNTPVLAIPIEKLDRNRQFRRELPGLSGQPTVRYAWPGPPGQAFTLRRNGDLALIQITTGDVIKSRNTGTEFGDGSCVKQFILPPEPNPHAYALYCIAGRPHVALIRRDGTSASLSLENIIDGQKVSISTKRLPRTVHSLDLDAAGHPTLIYSEGNMSFRLTLTYDLEAGTPSALVLTPADFPKPIYIRSARLTPKLVVADKTGRSYYFSGSPIFRDISMHDAESPGSPRVASVTYSTPTDERMSERLLVASSFYINDNRLIVNLTEGGVYLIDFNQKRISPLRRKGFGALEQIVSNTRGDWIYYRKYDKRILLFREPR